MQVVIVFQAAPVAPVQGLVANDKERGGNALAGLLCRYDTKLPAQATGQVTENSRFRYGRMPRLR